MGKTTEKKTTNMRGPTGPNMGPPRRERDSGDINPMAYQDHIGTDIKNQRGQRTTNKTTRPRLTGKRGRRAHQIQRATTAHQRQPGQCGIGGPRTQPTKPTQCPQIQKTGRPKDEANNGHKDPKRLQKSPRTRTRTRENRGKKERERKKKEEESLTLTQRPYPPPPEFASRGANPILPIIQARQGPIPGSYHG